MSGKPFDSSYKFYYAVATILQPCNFKCSHALIVVALVCIAVMLVQCGKKKTVRQTW